MINSQKILQQISPSSRQTEKTYLHFPAVYIQKKLLKKFTTGGELSARRKIIILSLPYISP